MGRNLSEHSWTSIRTLFLVGRDEPEAAAAAQKDLGCFSCGLWRDHVDPGHAPRLIPPFHNAVLGGEGSSCDTACLGTVLGEISAQTGAAWVIHAGGQLLPCQHRLRP